VTDKPSRQSATKGATPVSIWGDQEPDERPTTVAKMSKRRQYAHPNHRMLIWARESANIDLAKAAKRVGKQPAALASWEAGNSLPTIRQLRQLARLYRRPLAAFYLPHPPRQQFTVAHDYRRLPGEAPMAFSPALLFGIRVAAYRREIALGLDPESAASPIVGVGSRYDNMEEMAAHGRDLLGVSLETQMAWRGPYASLNGWKNAVEEQGVLVFHFTDVEVSEARGFSIGDRVLPVIGLNGSDGVNPRVFTLLHEVGHLMRGEGGSCDLAELRTYGVASPPAEVACNSFAAAVLLPRAALMDNAQVAAATRRSQWSDAQLATLSQRYGVSREVVLRRLVSLEKADIEFYRQWRADLLEFEAPAEGSTGRPPVAVMAVRDVGKPFARLVVDAYRSDAITGSDLSEYLGVRLKHLPAIEARLSGPDMLTGGER
jgi:Zn-dependent peptidase ImmA (M78 family)/transcriptional regulator with XRE-family HTH domain